MAKKKQVHPFRDQLANITVTANGKAKHLEEGKQYVVNMDTAKLFEARGWINESGFLPKKVEAVKVEAEAVKK